MKPPVVETEFCDSCRKPLTPRTRFPTNTKAVEYLRKLDFDSLCIVCVEPILEVAPSALNSLFKCRLLASLELDENLQDVNHLDVLGKVNYFQAKKFYDIIPKPKFLNKLDVLNYAVRYAKDSFADRRREMFVSFKLQAIEKPLSKKQRQCIHIWLSMINLEANENYTNNT